jgi:hypothetical protein
MDSLIIAVRMVQLSEKLPSSNITPSDHIIVGHLVSSFKFIINKSILDLDPVPIRLEPLFVERNFVVNLIVGHSGIVPRILDMKNHIYGVCSSQILRIICILNFCEGSSVDFKQIVISVRHVIRSAREFLIKLIFYESHASAGHNSDLRLRYLDDNHSIV